ncbi:MAG: hypothetical protein DWQ05_06490 [Calditrichaeota bacterium]|nr:MAG: hypothetical protein DWQ05_06490 [Calditrichota bacterium]
MFGGEDKLDVRKICFKLLLTLLTTLFIACGRTAHFVVPESLPDDRVPVKEMAERDINILGDGFDKQFTEQLEQMLDLSRAYRRISNNRKEALNVNALDNVENSSWFENRIHLGGWTEEMIKRGPDKGHVPDPGSTWTIFRAKAEGVTPGFSIIDEQGQRYVMKFDPIGYSGLSTGAEVVGTKLFYAAGFHVPENYIVYFDPKILKLGDDVKITDEKGRKRLMNQDDFAALLGRIERQPDGTMRAVASKYIPGKPKGPFRYQGTRKDDFNDIVPHQHRRELRGLKYIAAWLNHYDTKANNSYTSYLDEGYLRHWLIDFGSTLGSQGDEPMPAYIGHENTIDPHAMVGRLLTLGLWVKPWEKEWNVPFKSIGHFESKDFDPQSYDPIIPNPAFENATMRDAFWAARIIMSFSDSLLRAAVETGNYPEPGANEYLTKRLIERRDIVGRYVFSRINPLDGFALIQNKKGDLELKFRDLAVDSGLEQRKKSGYRYELLSKNGKILDSHMVGRSLNINLSSTYFKKISGDDNLQVRLQTKRTDNLNWSKPVAVYLHRNEKNGQIEILGLRRFY